MHHRLHDYPFASKELFAHIKLRVSTTFQGFIKTNKTGINTNIYQLMFGEINEPQSLVVTCGKLYIELGNKNPTDPFYVKGNSRDFGRLRTVLILLKFDIF